MKVEIIAVGNEIITGNTVNTNASYISRAVQKIGLTPYYHSAVPDDAVAIKEVLALGLKRADILILTGGLGPTDDDLTKEAVAKAIGVELIYREAIMEEIKQYFAALKKEAPANNKKQACFPEDCVILENPNGTASGCIIPYQSQFIVLLPGPPKELIPMVENGVLPYFQTFTKGVYETLDVKTFGIGESHLVELIEDLLGEKEGVSVAPYVGENEIIIRIRGFGKTKEDATKICDDIKNKLEDRLGSAVTGYNEDTIEQTILKLLAKNQYSIATAESCTGGLLAATLVNCSGVSDYFSEGIVTYSNLAKAKYIGVKEESLNCFGAVSAEVAKEMAEGIKKAANSNIGLSTTGIAGPGGGTLKKPVGLVYIGIALEDKTYTYELHLKGTREGIREKTVSNILFQLKNLLENSTC